MSKPRAKWLGYIRRVLYDYPRLRQELSLIQAAMQVTGEHSGGGSGIGRPAEALALATLPDPQEQRELEAVEKALEVSDELTCSLVSWYFFSRYSMAASALRCYTSKDNAYRRVAAFQHKVAQNLNLEYIDETRP